MKRKTLMLTLMAILLTVATNRAYAAELSISVDPSYLQVDIGQAFTVDINITGMEEPGLYGYELKLYYDNTTLQGIQVQLPEGHFLTPTLDPGNIFPVERRIYQDEGYASVAVTLLADEPGKTGSGILATIEFNGTALGEVSLELVDVILVDGEGETVPTENYDLDDGEVSVIPEFPVALLVPLFIAITLAIMLVKKKTFNWHG